MTQEISTSRRRFLQVGTTAAAMALINPLAARPGGGSGGTPTRAMLKLGKSATGRTVPSGLVGLSFETLQMHDTRYFSASNEALIGMLRRLNPEGVLRIGGNSSDYSVWSGYTGALPPFEQLPHAVFKRPYVITPEQLTNLAAFLDATGWRLVFGVNLRRGSPEMAAELAQAVRRAVGDRLEAIQIGNEPSLYKHEDGQPFSYDEYLALWRKTATAIRQRAQVPIAGPDTSNEVDWVLKFARDADDIVALTHHYYRGGAPAPTTTVAQMLAGDPAFIDQAKQVAKVAAAKKLPFLLTEANSYWGGGKLGVSNTFASALWGGDFALACAQAGVDGINIHSGTLSVLEASLDKNVATAPKGATYEQRLDAISGRYTPIAGDVGEGYYARPLYYGLLLARQFAGAGFVEAALTANGANLTTYAADRDGQRLLAVFNKDLQRDVDLQVDFGLAGSAAKVWRLQAPGIDDVHHTTLAGAAVGHAGEWSPVADETLRIAGGPGWLSLPRGSAALVMIGA
jgi:hypothetical protein